jgi:hypothetical protein
VPAVGPPASPLRCAEMMRSLPLSEGAALVALLDARFARLVLATVNRLARADWAATPEARAHDEVVRLLLQVRMGIYDHALRMSRSCFAVVPEVRPYLDRVAEVRGRERGP